MHTGLVFPTEGRIGLNWFTNAELITNNGRYPVFDILQGLDGLAPALERSNSILNDQFEYKLSISHESDLLALQARFGHGFGFAVFACTVGDRLESIFANLEARTGRSNPFELT